MAQSSELSLGLRAFLKVYRWRRIDPVPWSPMRKPLASSKIALVSTAGMVPRGQEPFSQQARGGDTSFRQIAGDVDVSTLVDSHRSESFDHRGIESDPNLGFPLDRIRELQQQGVIGALNHRHLSFMGSITAPGRLIAETAPAGAQLLVDDGVDAALLVPVWPMCNQAVGLIAAELERRGISTVCVVLLRDIAERVRPPRALYVPFPHGYALGEPHNPELQRSVVTAALALLDRDGPPPVIVDYEG